jgi:hypothetical protein
VSGSLCREKVVDRRAAAVVGAGRGEVVNITALSVKIERIMERYTRVHGSLFVEMLEFIQTK